MNDGLHHHSSSTELVHLVFAECEDGLPANVVARTERRNRSSSGEGTGEGVVVDPRRAKSAKATPVLRFLSKFFSGYCLTGTQIRFFPGSFSCKRTALSIFVLFLPFFLASEGGTQREAQSLLRLLEISLRCLVIYLIRDRETGELSLSRVGFL